MAGLVELQIEYQRLVAEREALATRYFAGERQLDTRIRELAQRIAFLARQIDSLLALNSSGDIVRDDQLGNTEFSNEISPSSGSLILENGRIRLPPDTNTQSNALKFNNTDNLDFGTDATLRPLLSTQSIPNGTTPGISPGPITADTIPFREPGESARDDAAVASQGLNRTLIPGSSSAGAGSASDDRGANELISSLNAIDWTDQILAQSNILNQYASYTYQASLYLIDRANAQRILNTGSKDLGGAKLLIQSGGAAPTGRSDFFSLDYYIDKIELKSFFVGKGTRLAHNVKEARMTVVEPNGISFVQNLDAAVQQYFGISTTNNKRNFASQIFLLVIKFYGYDDQGNLVRGGRNSNQTTNQTSDPNAFVEKFYPLIITKLDFRIASKAVEYDIHFKAPPYYINASQGRGTLPFNFEFSGKTVKDILAGPSSYSADQTAVAAGSPAARNTTTNETFTVEYEFNELTGETTPVLIPNNATTSSRPPPNASAVTPAKNTVRKGLMQRLNEYQQQLVKDRIVQYADEYNIEFVLDTIGSATVIQPGLDKSATSMATPGTAGDQKLPNKQSMDVNTQIQGVIAGTQIVQCIDQILRRSSYIRDQQTQIILNKNGDTAPGPGANLRNTAWYRIGFKAVPMLDKYDEIRNDYVYKITYTISPYKINQLNSPYFKPPVFNGVHKQYKYWFTGENTEVLNYEESLNNLYYIALTNTTFAGTSSVSGAQAINEQLKFLPSTASGQSTQGGGTPRTMEPAANAADQLYSPSDLKEGNLTIVGDPAWLQQGESFVALNKNNPDYFKAFLSDGTLNFDAQQILFEIAFNAPRDYNLATGLAQPTADRLNSTTQLDQVTKTPGPAQFSRIYIAKECTSLFERGKFIQHLKGSLMTYYPPGRGQGRRPPETAIAESPRASVQAAPPKTKAPAWAKPTSVTGQTPTSQTAIGVQQILRPASQLDNPTLTQLTSSPVYIQTLRNGAGPRAALAAARAAFAAGTNNYQGIAVPGIRDTSGTAVPGSGANRTQPIVKDGNPG
jgi:hypothetical protein